MDDKEKETESKAEKFSEKMTAMAETTALAFEQWLAENPTASKKEAHKRLVETIQMNSMMSLMGLMFI